MTCWQLLYQRCADHPEASVLAAGDGTTFSITIESETHLIGELLVGQDVNETTPPCRTAYYGPKAYEQCAWDAWDWLDDHAADCQAYSREYCDLDYCVQHSDEFP